MGLTRPRASQIYNLDYKQATRVVTVSNVTLSGGAPSVVDGVSLSANDRVLVAGQSTASQNGLYYVATVGSGSTGTWSRTTDTNETGEVDAGMIVMVTEGSIYADTQWKLITDNPITVGTTALTFTQNYSANSITAGTSNVVVTSNANVTISSGGTANVVTVATSGVYVAGIVSATGNITGSYFIGNGSQLTGISAGSTYSNSNVTTLLASFGSNTISTTGNITSGNLSAGTGTITGGNIINSNANGVGNIGSSTTYFNTVFAKATSAQYADLAECYQSDAAYAPGTVVEFGGDAEITITTTGHSTSVAGIISTNPSYLMNSTLAGENALEVALVGRVPCQVVGSIRKGDRLVSSDIAGTAQALNPNLYQPGCIVGKALEDYNSTEPGTIEVAVGRT